MKPLVVPKSSTNEGIRRSLSRSQTHRPSPGAGDVKANATFLTECSFTVSHDRLVQVITDVEPFEPYWETIGTIDLSKKNIESVTRLKEFLPKLDSLNVFVWFDCLRCFLSPLITISQEFEPAFLVKWCS